MIKKTNSRFFCVTLTCRVVDMYYSADCCYQQRPKDHNNVIIVMIRGGMLLLHSQYLDLYSPPRPDLGADLVIRLE